MLTTIEQVREWIKDNGFKRWVLYKDYSKTEKIIDSSAFPSETDDKIAMTEKYLRLAGGNAYAAGAPTNATSDLTTTAEIRLQDAQPQQPVQGVPSGYPSIGELRNEMMKSVRAEIEAENYRRDRANFEAEKKEFEEEKKSAMGALIHYFAPIGQQLLQNKLMRNVAGVDAEEPVEVHVKQEQPAQPEQPEVQEAEQPTVWDDFAEDEAERVMTLIARFKKVEPRYMELLQSVVEMAESGDSTYTMAKGVLLK